MKKIRWTGVIGGLIAVVFLVGGVEGLVNPTKFPIVNVATAVSNILWFLFGIFLIATYLREKKGEDLSRGEPVPESSVSDDKESLWRRRNKIFGYVLIVSILPSVGYWIMTDYSAGFTILSVTALFDLAINLVLFYLAVKLLKNRDVINPLFYTIIIYTLGAVIIGLVRGEWFLPAAQVIFGFYFVYAIKAPLSRHHHRVAHAMILPAIFVLMITLITIDDRGAQQLWKERDRLDQEFINSTEDVNILYIPIVALEDKVPTLGDLQDLEDRNKIRDQKIENISLLIEKLKTEYGSRIASEEKITTLESLNNDLAILELYGEQGEKIQEIVSYYKKLDLSNISNEQMSTIRSLNKEVDDLARRARDMVLEFESAH